MSNQRTAPSALLLVLLAVTLTAAEPPTDRELASRLLAAYVFVASGSGAVVDPSGLVLTNHHVIAAEDIRHLSVRFASGESHPARLLGTDPLGDIAVLQICRQEGDHLVTAEGPFPAVPLAPASAICPGIVVYAVGNPFGLGDLDSVPTLTRGVLSTGRIVREDYTDAIQVDAPVNPGNSGGPSFDGEGRLLGINGQIRTISGMRINSGVGLAIASPQLAAFLPRLALAEGGYVHHTALPKGLALMDGPDGVVVTAAPALPLQAGEIIVAIAGRPAVSVATAVGLGASLPYTQGMTLPLRLRGADGREREVALPSGRSEIPGTVWHGLQVSLAAGGLVVDRVDPGSPADAAGIAAGEILVRSGERILARKVDLLKALMPLGIGDHIAFTVRDATGAERTVAVLLRMAP